MGVSLIQYATAVAYGSSSAGQTIGLNGVGAGRCLVLGVAGYSNAVSNVVDTTTGHGSLAFTQGVRQALNPVWAEIWYLLSAYGGNTTITSTPTGPAYQSLFLAEFDGVDTVGQPRANASGGTNAFATSLQTGSFSATPTAGDLIVSVISLTTNGGASLVWDNGESTIGNQMNAGGNESGAMGWVLSDGTNTVRKATWSTASNSPQMAAIALKAAAVSTTKHFFLTLGVGK